MGEGRIKSCPRGRLGIEAMMFTTAWVVARGARREPETKRSATRVGIKEGVER